MACSAAQDGNAEDIIHIIRTIATIIITTIIMLLLFCSPVDVQELWCSKAAGCFLLDHCHRLPTCHHHHHHGHGHFEDNSVAMMMIKPPLISVDRHLSSLVLSQQLTGAPVGWSQVSH